MHVCLVHICIYVTHIYIYIKFVIYICMIPVVPHKAVAEV